MPKPKLRVVKAARARAPLYYRAEIVGGNAKIHAKRRRLYATRDAALMGALRWMLRDGQVGATIVVWHAPTGNETATVKMTAAGNIRTRYAAREEL